MREVHLLNFNLIKTVGEISDRKIQAITSHGFNATQIMPGHIAQFIDPSTGNAFAITQNQITYAVNSGTASKLFENPAAAIEIFNKVLDILMLESNSILQIVFEGSYETPNDAFEKSWELLSQQSVRIPGSKAVGLRIPIERDGIHGEVKIEPFFANPKRYFIGLNIQTTKSYGIADFTQVFQNGINIITHELEPLVKTLF